MGRQEIRFQSTDYGQGIIVCMGKILVLHFKVKGALVFSGRSIIFKNVVYIMNDDQQ